MKLFPNAVGAERKKIFWLIGLVATAIVAYIWSKNSVDTPAPATASVPAAQTTPAVRELPNLRREAPSIMPMQRTATRGGARPTEDFKPSLKPKEGVDLSGVDPTLHLERLAKLQHLAMEGGVRSVFKEGSAPVPPPEPVKIAVGPQVASASQPPPAPPKPDGPPPPPPPAPIPLKFYGFTSPRNGAARRAFFLDGDDFHIAGENDLIKNRYRVIRIGVNSAVVEDTTDKHQQTLPLIEALEG